ncbi:transposase [Mucilaginibacter sp.]
MKVLYADGACRGSFAATVEQVYHRQINISPKPEPAQGFVPQKGRWQVERSFGWLNFYRRLSKDDEKTAAAAVSFMQLAFISVIIARIC